MTRCCSAKGGPWGREQDNQVQLSVYSAFEDSGLSGAEWDAFIESVGGDILLSREWCELWWRHYGKGRRLKLFVFRKNGSIVGLLPLFVDRIVLGPVVARLVKIVGADYSFNAYCLPLAAEEMGQIAERFLEYMGNQRWWHVLHLGPVSGFYSYIPAITEALRAALRPGVELLVANTGVQSAIDGLTGYEEYLQRLGPTTRRNITRSYALLKKQSLELKSSLSSEQNAGTQFAKFVAMHQKKWEAEGRAGHFRSWPGSTAFHGDLALAQAQKGRLRLMEVSIGSEVIGYDYSYQMGAIQTDFLNARTMHPTPTGVHVGKVIWCEALKIAVERGVRIVDHMRGSSDFERLLGFKPVPIKSLFVIRASWFPITTAKWLFLCSRLVHLFYYRIWRNHVLPLLKLKQGALAGIWMQIHWLGESR